MSPPLVIDHQTIADLKVTSFTFGVDNLITVTADGDIIFNEKFSKKEAAVEFVRVLNDLLKQHGMEAKFDKVLEANK